jgi:stringent starvation protein B
MSMSSSRPYLIRAFYEWIVDNNCTPHILVNALQEGVLVPQSHVNKDGQVVLNISPNAVKNYSIDNEGLSFNARFGGVPTDVYVTCSSILGIYAKENQQGMIFDLQSEPEGPPPPKDRKKPTVSSKTGIDRPSLRIVK